MTEKQVWRRLIAQKDMHREHIQQVADRMGEDSALAEIAVYPDFPPEFRWKKARRIRDRQLRAEVAATDSANWSSDQKRELFNSYDYRKFEEDDCPVGNILWGCLRVFLVIMLIIVMPIVIGLHYSH